MQPTSDTAAFRLFNEIGIIDQLARHRLESNLPDGLKASQFGVLNHLERLGGEWAPARLAKALQVTRGAMTNTLQRLEKRGLISISADPGDGRAKLVTITAAGRDLRLQCVKNVAPLLAEITEEISARDIAQALPVLEKIRKYLDENRP